MKKSEAAEIVMMLMSAFPNAKTSEGTSRVYESMLVDLDAALARTAVQRLLATSRFLPTIAEIREAATAQQLGPCPRGEEAWAALLQAKRAYGYDYGPDDVRRRRRDPLFADEHIRRCLTLWGGWNAFALADEDAPARARFVAMYDELAQRERRDVVAGQTLPAPALERARNNRAALALVAPPGAPRIVPPVLVGTPAAPAPENASTGQSGPVTVPIAPPRQRPGPTPFQRRVSVEELDAELAKAGGAP